MHDTIARNKDTVSHLNITTQKSIVGKNNLIAHSAVVTDMRTRHEEIFIADRCRRTRGCTAVNLNVFAKNIVSAYSEVGFFPFVTFVLGGITQNNARMDFVAFADLRPASQICMRHDSRAALYPDRAFDDDVRANLDFGVNFRLGIDNGRRMNAHENNNYPVYFPTPGGYRFKTEIRKSEARL